MSVVRKLLRYDVYKWSLLLMEKYISVAQWSLKEKTVKIPSYSVSFLSVFKAKLLYSWYFFNWFSFSIFVPNMKLLSLTSFVPSITSPQAVRLKIVWTFFTEMYFHQKLKCFIEMDLFWQNFHQESFQSPEWSLLSLTAKQRDLNCKIWSIWSNSRVATVLLHKNVHKLEKRQRGMGMGWCA